MTAGEERPAWLAIAGRPRAERAELVRARLGGDPALARPRVVDTFARLLDLPIFVIAADRVARHLARAGAPERAALALEDAVGRLESTRGDASPLFVEPILGALLDLAGASAWAARTFAADPAAAIELGARIEPGRAPAELRHPAALARIVAATFGDTPAFDRRLRRYRAQQLFALALRELREGDVRETARDLADLASAALQAALDHHLPRIHAELGVPDPACAHAVIGMGKLGGRELNFSSDVDVLYFYEHDEGGAGALSQHQLHVKLFERVTASLARASEHGFVFRVDLDLRPEGRSGPLANSLAGAERYYETWGRSWERAAWIKGRPVAGSAELGARVVASMRPFVYRRSFDLAAIEEIFAMKAKLDAVRKREARRGAGAGVDVKLGPGGIREIELWAQSLQLLHGGRDRRLRAENTLDALQALEAAGHIRAKTRERLADAYLLLRKVEHRVQLVEDQQTHVVPRDPALAAPLARTLGFASPDALEAALARTMEEVHALFTNLLGAAQELDPVPPEVELALDREAPEAERLRVLAEAGAESPELALANLARAALSPRSPLHPSAPEHERTWALHLVAECWASPSLDRAVGHLPDLVRALASHHAYLSGLERPALRRGVARVLGASDLLARILVASPSLLEQVLLARELPTPGALAKELEARLADADGDVEAALDVLRQTKQVELLRTAVADLAGHLTEAEVSERLTALAELLLGAALRLAEAEQTARYGEARTAEGARASVVIVAGGTLGAHEMGYRSDLDLSVIHDGEGETTGGERGAVHASELFTRVAQRLLTFLTLKTDKGELYAVDLRLRPSGSQGALVTSLASFTAYHRGAAELWERQALVRARTVAGEEGLRAAVDRAIGAAAFEAPLPDGAAAAIHAMRLRMSRERAPRPPRRTGAPGERPRARDTVLDLKLGPGGLVELEFLVQYLLLRHGGARPALRTPSTRQALARLAEAGLLDPERAARLVEAHDRIRRVQSWRRLAHDAPLDHVELAPSALRPLARAAGYQGNGAEERLARDLVSDTAAVHLCYTEVLGAP